MIEEILLESIHYSFEMLFALLYGIGYVITFGINDDPTFCIGIASFGIIFDLIVFKIMFLNPKGDIESSDGGS